jgi:gamma-glutamyltranspeptidase / glutathione hydrolase
MKIFKLFFPVLILLSCAGNKAILNKTGINPFQYEINKEIVVDKAAVVSAHPLASKVGVSVMKNGGNAFDAAIATQLALAVVYPGAGNLGGGGFLVAHRINGEKIALDFREKAPAAAQRDMYLDKDGSVIKDLSVNGHLSSGVPGTVAGIFQTLPYAKLSINQLIEPSIELAEKGFVITAREASSLNGLASDFKKYSTTRTAFQKDQPWKEGDTLVQKDLANTLRRIRDKGHKGFYEGETAGLIVEEMKRGGGIISLDDLKNYEAKFRVPHSFSYRGHSIVSMPLPSSGGILLNQMFKMIEPYNIRAMGFHTPEAVQLMIEAERRAYADRSKFMGDADFYAAPVDSITSQQYLRQRMADFIPGKAGNSKQTTPGFVKGSEETTHISIMDAWGNAVAVTTTLNNGYGSKTVVGGAGFIMNDEMDDFSIKPGVPNIYGALGGKANAIEPGKRMLSAMSPTIVLKDGKPLLIVGTPGGTTIPTSVFQTIINIVDFDLSTNDAVNKPKFHHQWLPDVVDVERSFPANLISSLEKMGYVIKPRSAIGRTEVIKILNNGKLEAVADKRGDDSAEGF